MGLLDGGAAAMFAAAFGGIFLDGQLYRPASTTDDGAGGGSGSGFDPAESIKVQLEAATDAMRQAEGYVDTDVRILVLASGVERPSADCQVVVTGHPRFGIRNVGRDPAGAYWDLHGRLAG